MSYIQFSKDPKNSEELGQYAKFERASPTNTGMDIFLQETRVHIDMEDARELKTFLEEMFKAGE